MGIPPELPVAQILKWQADAKKGKPVPWEMHYHDDGRVEVIYQPIPRPAAPPRRRRPGRPQTLTLDQLADHLRRHPRKLSDAARAAMLTKELHTSIARSVVQRLRRQLEKLRA